MAISNTSKASTASLVSLAALAALQTVSAGWAPRSLEALVVRSLETSWVVELWVP
jgi:hypothetical protein